MQRLTASNVHETLRKHVLVDGFDIVPDLAKSRDGYLADARDGRRYLDFFSFYASQPLGFNHPRLAETSFVNRLGRAAIHKPSNPDMNTVEMAEFVSTFGRVGIPPELPHLFLVDGGALAVENALKTAFDWKVRRNVAKGLPDTTGQQILHFRQAFHGRSGYTLSLTNTADQRKTMYFPKFAWPRCSNPAARFPLEGNNVLDTEDREIQSLSEVRQAFRERPDEIAAVIIEPIQCEGGENHFRGEFLLELQKITREMDALFILDEVQTGVVATGRFWCYQHFGLEPDIVAFGKKMQVCGIMASRRIDEVERNVFVESSRINSTWGGNLVDMVRATRILEVIEQDKLEEHARTMGDMLLGGLKELASMDDRFTNVRARGLLAAFDLPSPELRDRFRLACREKGLLVLNSGQRSIRLRPALNVKKAELEHGFSLLRDVQRLLK